MAAQPIERLRAALSPAYDVQRELGQGGMATVYLARDIKHSRLVALKVLHQNLAATLGPDRFRREITMAAALQHPHILSVYDSGETADGLLWFTMPYVQGETLRQRLTRESQLPVDVAVRLTREVASALFYAHRQGIVHRDIKPENILLTAEGDALLADFGIARALGSDAGIGAAPGTALTQAGSVIGTPRYMSPEQATGSRELDGTSDIYSLGAVLYEMLAGETPFTGPSAQAIIAKMLSSEAPSIRRVRPAVPQAVDVVLRKALAPVAADRWKTAADFSRELDQAERTGTTGEGSGTATRRRVPTGAIMLGLGFAVGLGVLFAWKSRAPAVSGAVAPSAASGAIRIAILPFDNIGDTTDAYFADGITDAVRSKLAGVSGMEVIGSASSGQYRRTTKTPQQIGQELGVRYLVIGKVRWAKAGKSESRVQVSPELIDVSTAADKWAQSFDAPLTDVFQVQGDIAGKVAKELQVALSPADQQTLTAKPTSDLLAYDAYLRGRALSESGNAPIVIRRAISALREAVVRDSTFALAWSALGSSYGLLYTNGVPVPAIGDSADMATARALALAPDLAESHAARSRYYAFVLGDNARAVAEAEAGLTHGRNVAVLRAAALAELALGNIDAAAAHAGEAVRLDPRDPTSLQRVAIIELSRRHPAKAIDAATRALALRPGSLPSTESSIMANLQRGDLAGARAVIGQLPPTADPDETVVYFAQYWDLGWVLDQSQEKRLLSVPLAFFDGDRATLGIVRAQQYWLRGDSIPMRAYADTARLTFIEQLKAAPNDDQRHAILGLSLAYLGRNAEAAREVERALQIRPIDKDLNAGLYNQHIAARVYGLIGQPDRALDLLTSMLEHPYFVTGPWLRIDPYFKMLRGNPRFEKLIADHPTKE